MVAQAVEWPGNQALGQGKGSRGGKEAEPGRECKHSAGHYPGLLALGQGGSPKGRPHGFPLRGIGSWGSGSRHSFPNRLKQSPHSVVGRASESPEKWEAPYFKPQRTKGWPTRLGQGGGAPQSYSQPSAGPRGKFTASKPHPPRGQREAVGLPLSTSKAMQIGGWGPIRSGPLHLQLLHSQLSGWQGSQHLPCRPLQVGQDWVGSDKAYPSSPGNSRNRDTSLGIWDP